MAAVRVTAPQPGDGEALAALWRDLWWLHEQWGGYRAARGDAMYRAVAERLEHAARLRDGDPLWGQHLHLVARAPHGEVLGQVEGWLDAAPLRARAPVGCEVRSLVVAASARGRGVGKALMEALAALAQGAAKQPVFLTAEVLERNPAHGFYARLGMRSFAESHMLWPPRTPSAWPSGWSLRRAQRSDSLAVARLWVHRLERLARAGDRRVQRAAAIDAVWLGRVATELSTGDAGVESWVLLQDAQIVAEASLWLHPLESPFVWQQRAVVERLALSPSSPWARAHASLLLAELSRRAQRLGAERLELTDAPAVWSEAAGERTRYSRRLGRLLAA